MRERPSHADPDRSRDAAPPPPRTESRPDRIADVMATLERGVEGILDDAGFAAYLRMLARFHRYSFANTLLIMAQKPDATMVNSYKRWQELGRQVRKGETGIKIFYPRRRKIEEEAPDEEGNPERFVLSGFGVGSVFDIGQTDGEVLPEPPPALERAESDETARAINLRLSRYLIDQGVRLESVPMHGHRQGSWSPATNTISVRRHTYLDVDEDGRGSGTERPLVDPLSVQKTKTLVHEAAHWQAGHRGAIDRGDAETVAESCAYVVLQHWGIDTGGYSFPYVARWGRDREVLRRNLHEIQQVSSTLITAIEGEPAAEEVP